MFNLHCAAGLNCRVWHWKVLFFNNHSTGWFYDIVTSLEAHFLQYAARASLPPPVQQRSQWMSRHVVFSGYTMNNDLHIHRFWEKGGGDVILRILNQVIELLCRGGEPLPPTPPLQTQIIILCSLSLILCFLKHAWRRTWTWNVVTEAQKWWTSELKSICNQAPCSQELLHKTNCYPQQEIP